MGIAEALSTGAGGGPTVSCGAGATGFGLYDRRVVDTLKQWRDPEPFFRGMLVESGFRLETIPYHRPARAGGVSKNNFGTLVSFALVAMFYMHLKYDGWLLSAIFMFPLLAAMILLAALIMLFAYLSHHMAPIR